MSWEVDDTLVVGEQMPEIGSDKGHCSWQGPALALPDKSAVPVSLLPQLAMAAGLYAPYAEVPALRDQDRDASVAVAACSGAVSAGRPTLSVDRHSIHSPCCCCPLCESCRTHDRRTDPEEDGAAAAAACPTWTTWSGCDPPSWAEAFRTTRSWSVISLAGERRRRCWRRRHLAGSCSLRRSPVVVAAVEELPEDRNRSWTC